jgi:hypothetical protein
VTPVGLLVGIDDCRRCLSLSSLVSFDCLADDNIYILYFMLTPMCLDVTSREV